MSADHREEVVDVIVVGGGGAGMAAAVSAATHGAQVLVLEKNPELGGTTRLSVGSISAAGTRLQKAAGIDDCPDHFREDMAAFAGELTKRDDPALRDLLAREAATTVSWLEDMGVVFAGPFPEPPHRVARMHNVIPGPQTYISRLARAARRAGVRICVDARTEKLLTGADGGVTGVDYIVGGERRSCIARRGVVLASGDFAGNRDMRAEHLPGPAVTSIPCNPRATGDGHRLAREIGAGWRNMDIVFGPHLRFAPSPRPALATRLPDWPWLARLGAAFLMHAPSWMVKPVVAPMMVTWLSPTDRMFREGSVLVDLDGNRLSTEKAGVSIAASREATAYILLNDTIASRFMKYPDYISTAPGVAYAYFSDYLNCRPDIVHSAATVDELAAKIGMSAEQLRASAQSLGSGTLYAMGPVHAVLSKTEGSLTVDVECRVLHEDGQPIAGLYAAGSVGQGGMPMKGHGLHIAWAMTSGRIAGAGVAGRVT